MRMASIATEWSQSHRFNEFDAGACETGPTLVYSGVVISIYGQLTTNPLYVD
jgi:hypothetical protein